MINALLLAAAIAVALVIMFAPEYGRDAGPIRALTDTEYRCQKFTDETVPTWQPHERYMSTYRACIARNAK